MRCSPLSRSMVRLSTAVAALCLAATWPSGCSSESGSPATDDTEEDYGIDGPFGESEGPVGKADNAGVPGPLVATDTSATQVWTARNKWEDTDTPAAKAAGIAWGANSGLNWDQKYVKWIESMERTRSDNGYYDTFTLTTPWGKTLPAPKLECSEVAMFLRIAFASWYELPFYLTGTDSNGTRVYFGHFGARTKSERYKNTPNYALQYKDYSSMTAEQLAAQGWPKDTKLRAKGLIPSDDQMDFVEPGAHAGAYFDEVFLNKRVGHFLVLVLDYFGSMHLADSRNTFNLKPDAIRAGDVLLERWQKNGIGHTLVIKHAAPLDEGKIEAQLVSGSMPRRQPKWEDGIASKNYFTSDYTGGEGTNSDGDEYVKLGGGIKRWRVTRNINGYWTNTWMPGDEASWISDTDYEHLKTRPSQFEAILGEVPPDQMRDALLAMIEDARNHLRQYPASCSARERREDAFKDLYVLMQNRFSMSKAQVDRAYRSMEDYIFAELEYAKSKTCCWNSTTSAMYQIIKDYNDSLQTGACVEPTVFKATGGGYAVFKAYAEQTGRGSMWREWSEDEPCAQRGVADDTETAHEWIPWCSVNQSGGGTTTSCTDDTFEQNDNPNAATSVSAGSYGNLKICAGDEDYFKITISGGSLTVRASFDNDEGDLDMELFQGTQSIGSSTSTSDQEQVTASGAGTYTVRVYGYSGASAAYSLTIMTN